MNSPTVGGDYRFTLRSLAGVATIVAGGVAVWAISRRWESYLRFFLLFTWCLCGIVLLGTLAKVHVVPQPHRYQVAMDMGLCLTAVFGIAALVGQIGKGTAATLVRHGIAAVVLLACVAAFIHQRAYAQSLIRSTDITQTATYRIAMWMDTHMGGRRVMVSGAHSFPFNVFTDTPQVHGGHDPMLPNFVIRIATFTIYSGMNAGTEDAAISTIWLQALGAHAISVPGPRSDEFYKPVANPHKFEGVLPVLWREGDDTIYGVPARSVSLAHLVPEQSLVRHEPVHGLDVAELRRYVAALNDSSMPEAPMMWQSRHRAEIRVQPRPEAAVSVQITYHPGWRAWVDGREISVGRDRLGFVVLRPDCLGSCTITLNYDGGPELYGTTLASTIVMLGTLAVGWRRRLRSRTNDVQPDRL
jgi:hypothetical protein